MDRYERNRILMERIIRLAEEIIELCKKLPKIILTARLYHKLLILPVP